jgi:CBS domain-containing protein
MTMYVDTILQLKGTAVLTLGENSTLADAVALLTRHNIGALIILDAAGQVAGILSERDIIRQLGVNAAEALTRPVSTCMTHQLVTCDRATPIAKVMEDMTQYRVRHVPVLEDGQLAGIISIGDVVKHKIAEVEREAEELRDYIAS